MDRKGHWEGIYRTKGAKDVSWFAPHLAKSLEIILSMGIKKSDPIIDVGAGASTLVDDLVREGFSDITALDISEESLGIARKRLADKAAQIHWIADDITRTNFPKGHFALWHDRAVFHFLTNEADRQKYRQLLTDSLKPKGYAILSTFSLDGPPKCSGLDVVRYSPKTLSLELGAAFELLRSFQENHKTPFDTTQRFNYCVFQKI